MTGSRGATDTIATIPAAAAVVVPEEGWPA